jgi:AraC-like DNA-binding protein
MHTLVCQPASPDLQVFVRAYAQREVFDLPGPVSEPVPARLEQTLEFQFGEHFEVANATRHESVGSITLVGSYTEGGFAIALKNRIISFGIFFQPVGLSRLFNVPPVEVSNHALDASAGVLPGAIRQLHDQLAVLSFEARVIATEKFLRIQAARSSARDDDVGCNAATRIFSASGAVRTCDLASHYGLSLRQFERRFTHRIGILPKTYARVARFQSALDTKLLMPHRSWLTIAHDLAYHDQMHMIHDFHALAGAAPSEVLATIRDARPPAMPNFSQF